jgi:small-conductance mechanosensitive channel
VEAVKHDVQREAEKREAEDRNVLRQIEDVSAGGLSLEWIGLWWLFVGVLFTSVPTQVAGYLPAWL